MDEPEREFVRMRWRWRAIREPSKCICGETSLAEYLFRLELRDLLGFGGEHRYRDMLALHDICDQVVADVVTRNLGERALIIAQVFRSGSGPPECDAVNVLRRFFARHQFAGFEQRLGVLEFLRGE